MPRPAALFALAWLLASTACASQPALPPVDPGPYPARWWEPVPQADAPEWEILPQAARPPQVILSKRHELGILSNFADTPFELGGRRYASLEGFWQSMKYPEGPDDPRAAKGVSWKHTRAEVADMVAFEAHSAGVAAEANMQALGIEWVSHEGERIHYKGVGVDRHYELIVAATWAKVRQNRRVLEVLRATGDLELLPDHHEDAEGTKAWRYYAIYMAIRTELAERGWSLDPPGGAIEAGALLANLSAKAGVLVSLAPSLDRTLSAAERASIEGQPSWERTLSRLSEVLGGRLRQRGSVYELYRASED